MKIINLLYRKYFLSLSICVICSLTIFFIFSLIGNLNENYNFLIVLKTSILNSIQILIFVPTFIYLLSIVLMSIFLRSKNEITIIKSYFSLRLLITFILPIVFIFTVFEVSKNELNLIIENYKINLISEDNHLNIRILKNKSNNSKNYIVLKNFEQNDAIISEYRSYSVSNDIIQTAEFSDKINKLKDSFLVKEHTKYKDDSIKDINIPKIININYQDLIQNRLMVKDISEKKYFNLSIKLFNNIIYFILFFICVFLYFFSSSYVNIKQSLKNPIFISLIALIYSFFVFNNSLTFYRQEFEVIASIIAGIFFIKVYLNE